MEENQYDFKLLRLDDKKILVGYVFAEDIYDARNRVLENLWEELYDTWDAPESDIQKYKIDKGQYILNCELVCGKEPEEDEDCDDNWNWVNE